MTSNEDPTTGLADLAGLRHRTYLLFGSLFHHPDPDQLGELISVAGELRSQDELAREFPFYRSWSGVLDFVAKATDEEAERLQEEYVGLFQVATEHPPCPLYESAYVDHTGRMTGWITSQVEQSYAAGGLTLSSAGKQELPDHAGLELEFMALLCGAEAQAWESGAADEATDSLTLQRTFLEQHLHRWFPRLAHRLCSVAAETSLYRRLADATLAFVVHDADLVRALAEEGLASAGKSDGAEA